MVFPESDKWWERNVKIKLKERGVPFQPKVQKCQAEFFTPDSSLYPVTSQSSMNEKNSFHAHPNQSTMNEASCLNITLSEELFRHANIANVAQMEAIANHPEFHLLLVNQLKMFHHFLVNSSNSSFLSAPRTSRNNLNCGDSAYSSSDVGCSSSSSNRPFVPQTNQTNTVGRIAREDTSVRSARLRRQAVDDTIYEEDETSFLAPKRPDIPNCDKTQARDIGSDVFKVPRLPPSKRNTKFQNSDSSDVSSLRGSDLNAHCSRSGRVYKEAKNSWFQSSKNIEGSSSNEKASSGSAASRNSDRFKEERPTYKHNLTNVQQDRLKENGDSYRGTNEDRSATKRGRSNTERETNKPSGDGVKNHAKSKTPVSGKPRRGRPRNNVPSASESSSLNVTNDREKRTRSSRALLSSFDDDSDESFRPPPKTSVKIVKSAPGRKNRDQTMRSEPAQEETRSVSKAAAKVNTDTVTKTAPKVKTGTATKAASKVNTRTVTKAAAKVKTGTASRAAADVNTGTVTKTAAKVKPGTATKAAAEVNTGTVTKTAAKVKTGTATKAAAKENSKKARRAHSEDLSDEESPTPLVELSYNTQLRRNRAVLESLKARFVGNKGTGKRALPSNQTSKTARWDSDEESETDDFQRAPPKKTAVQGQKKKIRENDNNQQPVVNKRGKRNGLDSRCASPEIKKISNTTARWMDKDAAPSRHRRYIFSGSSSDAESVGDFSQVRRRKTAVLRRSSSEDSDSSDSNEQLYRFTERSRIHSSALQKGPKRIRVYSDFDVE